jgi:hypothetical protein
MQTNLAAFQNWFKKWRKKANKSKLVHVTSPHEEKRSLPVHINYVKLFPEEDIKYLGLHLDRRLTCRKYIFTKWKQLGITLNSMYWLLRHKLKLSTSNKHLTYKTKRIWTYAIQLWGMTSTSNIKILEHFQSKALHMIVDAPCYMRNTVFLSNLQTPAVKERILCYSSQYSARLSAHPNDQVVNLIVQPDNNSDCEDNAK